MISAFDEAVGKIVDSLKEQNLYWNTFFVFTSDVSVLHTNKVKS